MKILKIPYTTSNNVLPMTTKDGTNSLIDLNIPEIITDYFTDSEFVDVLFYVDTHLPTGCDIKTADLCQTFNKDTEIFVYK